MHACKVCKECRDAETSAGWDLFGLCLSKRCPSGNELLLDDAVCLSRPFVGAFGHTVLAACASDAGTLPALLFALKDRILQYCKPLNA